MRSTQSTCSRSVLTVTYISSVFPSLSNNSALSLAESEYRGEVNAGKSRNKDGLLHTFITPLKYELALARTHSVNSLLQVATTAVVCIEALTW